ncbi:MAG: hypothetical protein Q9220_007373 [cf. Caloplaca sp. 1 TL-2023]
MQFNSDHYVPHAPPASSKHQLQSVTRKLLDQGSPPDMQHSRKSFNPMDDPVKFSPPDEGRRNRRINDTDIYTRSEDRLTKFDDLLREYEKTNPQVSPSTSRYQPTKYQHRPKGLSQSVSENNIGSYRLNAQKYLPPTPTGDDDGYEPSSKTADYPPDEPSFAQSRGRLPRCSPSPTRILEAIRENQTPENNFNQRMYTDPPKELPESPVKRSRSPMKQLFGDKGFLGRSTSMKELPSEDFRKKGVKHFGEKLRQRVGGMLIPISNSAHESPSKSTTTKYISTFPVSLSPPEQAKFYSETELMIVATANKYLITQKEEGRMSYESIAKVTNFWAQKNRPQVIDFMFDQLTQRDLILYNLKTFRFYGPNAENMVCMNAMMNSWKTLAKEMSIRTFCTGDSTIRKHIHDIYGILDMLGAPPVTFMAFQQSVVKVLATIRDQQKIRDDYESVKFGVERQWEPPGGFGPSPDARSSAESEKYINPFTDDWRTSSGPPTGHSMGP